MDSSTGGGLPKPYRMDVWLSKFPLSQNMKVFVTTVTLIGGMGYWYFKDFKTGKKSASGSDLLDSQRPEAVFKAMDDAEKKKLAERD